MSSPKNNIPKSVLLIETDSLIQTMTKNYLESCGVSELEVSNNARRAIDSLDYTDFDLIILDWKFKRPPGKEIFLKIREHEKYELTPIILISGAITKDDVQVILTHKNTNFLVKPFTEDVMKGVIAKWFPGIKNPPAQNKIKLISGAEKRRQQEEQAEQSMLPQPTGDNGELILVDEDQEGTLDTSVLNDKIDPTEILGNDNHKSKEIGDSNSSDDFFASDDDDQDGFSSKNGDFGGSHTQRTSTNEGSSFGFNSNDESNLGSDFDFQEEGSTAKPKKQIEAKEKVVKKEDPKALARRLRKEARDTKKKTDEQKRQKRWAAANIEKKKKQDQLDSAGSQNEQEELNQTASGIIGDQDGSNARKLTDFSDWADNEDDQGSPANISAGRAPSQKPKPDNNHLSLVDNEDFFNDDDEDEDEDDTVNRDGASEELFKASKGRLDGSEDRFDGSEDRFDGSEDRFDDSENRFDDSEKGFDDAIDNFDGLGNDFDHYQEDYKISHDDASSEDDEIHDLSSGPKGKHGLQILRGQKQSSEFHHEHGEERSTEHDLHTEKGSRQGLGLQHNEGERINSDRDLHTDKGSRTNRGLHHDHGEKIDASKGLHTDKGQRNGLGLHHDHGQGHDLDRGLHTDKGSVNGLGLHHDHGQGQNSDKGLHTDKGTRKALGLHNDQGEIQASNDGLQSNTDNSSPSNLSHTPEIDWGDDYDEAEFSDDANSSNFLDENDLADSLSNFDEILNQTTGREFMNDGLDPAAKNSEDFEAPRNAEIDFPAQSNNEDSAESHADRQSNSIDAEAGDFLDERENLPLSDQPQPEPEKSAGDLDFGDFNDLNDNHDSQNSDSSLNNENSLETGTETTEQEVNQAPDLPKNGLFELDNTDYSNMLDFDEKPSVEPELSATNENIEESGLQENADSSTGSATSGLSSVYHDTSINAKLAESNPKLAQTISPNGKETKLPSSKLGIKKVLLVDGDGVLRTLIENYLKDIGVVEIKSVDSGADVWGLLADEKKFDVVLMAWKITGISALAIYNRIRSHKAIAKSPVIVFSGFVAKQDFRILEESRYTKFIEKPFQIQVLDTVLTDLFSTIKTLKNVEHTVDLLLKETNKEGVDLLDLLRHVLKKIPNAYTFVISVSQQLYKEGRYVDAEKSLKIGLKLQPNNVEILTLLGKIYHRLNRPDEAYKVLGQAKGFSPHNIERLCLLGEVGLTLRDPKNARIHFFDALKIDMNIR